MSSVNQVTIIGHLGKNPDVLNITEQGCFVRLSLATNRKYKNKEGKVREDVQWHTVYLSNNIGKWAASALRKGAKVFVTGELRNCSWQGKDGLSRSLTAIYAKEIKFLSIKQKENEGLTESFDEESTYEKAKQEIDLALGRLSEKK